MELWRGNKKNEHNDIADYTQKSSEKRITMMLALAIGVANPESR